MNPNSNFSQINKLVDRFKRFAIAESGAQSLSGRASRSGAWVFGGFIIQRTLQFASNLILTRLLFPEAFGLMALASVFVVGLAMFSDLGIQPAIIRDARGSDPIFLNTAWTIQVIRGFVLFTFGSILAYPISIIYNQPELFQLLAVLSITPAIAGFASVKMITAERDLDFRTVTYVQTLGQLFMIITMIAFAYLWKSVWALAVGNIIGMLVTVIAGHLFIQGHHHKINLNGQHAKSLISFGKWIFLSTIVTYLGGEGLRAVQGGFISPREFGILAIAYTIASIPLELTMKLTSSIGLPALSEAYRSDRTTVSHILHEFRKRVLFIAFVLVATVVLVSETVVGLLYDQRYHAAGPFVVAITLSGAVSLIFSGYNNALLALGRSQTYLWMMTLSAVSRIIGLIVGFDEFGIMGMIVGIGIANIVVLVVGWLVMFQLKLLDFTLDIGSLFIILVLGGLASFVI